MLCEAHTTALSVINYFCDFTVKHYATTMTGSC